MATKAQVRNKALKKLRVLEEGETPTNEVIADVEGIYDEVYAYLSKNNAVTWDSTEDVPSVAVRPVVTIIAAEAADDFGVDEGRYQRLQVEAYGPDGLKDNITGGAISHLQSLAKNAYVPTTTTAEYY